MNHSSTLLKCFYRLILLTLLLGMTYVVTRAGYNFAHWVPHDFLRSLGLSYASLLWAEQNADVALHFFGAALLTSLIYLAKLPLIENSAKNAFLAVSMLCLGAELVQMSIGRGYQNSDLLLGILGGFMAYLLIEKNKQSPN